MWQQLALPFWLGETIAVSVEDIPSTQHCWCCAALEQRRTALVKARFTNSTEKIVFLCEPHARFLAREILSKLEED